MCAFPLICEELGEYAVDLLTDDILYFSIF